VQALITTFLSSALIILLLIRYQHIHSEWSHDSKLDGPQKFHKVEVPRIGGVGLYLAILALLLINYLQQNSNWKYVGLLLISGLPAFTGGLSEDLTKKVKPIFRLLLTLSSAFLAGYFFDFWVSDIGFEPINFLLAYLPCSILFTCIAIAGLSNAYNIIDGFNGLASMIGIIALVSIAYVGFRVNDLVIIHLSISMIGALMGFFLWNYPRGLIFLGDGGAYFVGFWIASLTILLISRNSSVSPWFALLINIYPVFETLFSIWRRLISRGRNPGVPDGVHFHSLIYRRIVKWAHVNPLNESIHERNSNARTSPYLWAISSMGTIPAVLWWNSTLALVLWTFIFIGTYIALYRAIVLFKKPTWLTH
jgi:UDP-GlcNAc:undecaprenyl-phosphate/decaprenyl-phosphate GlcNAc-1-phosphate transferase